MDDRIFSRKEAQKSQKLNPSAPFVPYRGYLHFVKLS